MRWIGNTSRMWVTLQCLSRSELPMRMAEKCIQFVSPTSVFDHIRTTEEWLNAYSDCEILSIVWEDQSDQRELLNAHLESESLLQSMSRSEMLMRMVEHGSRGWVSLKCPQIRTVNNNGWIHIQTVSLSQVFENHWWGWLNMHTEWESELLSLYLRRSEPLTKMAEHASRVWVSPMFEQIRTTEENDWTHVQIVSLSFEQIRNSENTGWTFI